MMSFSPTSLLTYAVVSYLGMTTPIPPVDVEPTPSAPPSPSLQLAQKAPSPAAAKDKSVDDGALDPKLEKVIKGLQRKYEGTTDFSANFDQVFTYTVMRRSQSSQGTVMFKRPGLMRWDYGAPTPKTFAVGNGRLTIFQPEDHTAMVDHCFKEDGLTASVSFLWGAGDIKKQFDVKWFDGQFGEKNDHHLLLTPKEKNSVFLRLILVVDPKDYAVKQSVLVDSQGNVNQFVFTDLKLNRGLKRKAFDLTLPKGVKASRLPGTCNPDLKKPKL